jgi:hypothetical protein
MENIVPLNYTELESIIVGDSNDGIIIENERVHNISIKEQRAKMQLEMIDSYKSALERITQVIILYYVSLFRIHFVFIVESTY